MDRPATDRPSYPEYEQLVKLARQRAGRFVDPSNLTPEAAAVQRRGEDWARAVLGRWYTGAHGTALWESHLLMLADELDITPPLPAHIVAARERTAAERTAQEKAHLERQQTLDSEWSALVAALSEQGMQIAVAHNYQSARHCENGYVQGADHILPQQPIQKGRFARLKHQALCSTDSNRHNHDFPHPDSGDERRPTCKACIRRACKLTGLDAPTMLGRPHANGGAGIPNRVFTAKTPRGRGTRS